MTTRTESTARPLRRDAELNLERILLAAEEVFAEGGFEASMEQVAQRAGVGVGTLYRRFPGKESLVAAIIEMARERSKLLAETVFTECPPAEGLFEFMRRCAGMPPSLRALVSQSPDLAETHRLMVAGLAPPVERLIAAAKEAGALRKDVTFSDIVVALISARAIQDRWGDAAAPQRARHLELLIDGLRQTTTKLPHRPLSRAQLNELLGR